MVELQNDYWSEELKQIVPRVKKLFYSGNIDLLAEGVKRVAVIGSRAMSQRGEKMVAELIPVLVSEGIVVVSGLMYGVDVTAHRECLKNGGKTVAVLGWGIEKKLTVKDQVLKQRIMESQGLVISEYPGEMNGAKYTFPQRDRIEAGISKAVLVIEADLASGTMITANWAKKYGRKVFAVPGSEGADWLIKKGEARVIKSREDLKVLLGANLTFDSVSYNVGVL